MDNSKIEITNDIRFFILYALFNGPFEYRQEYGNQMTPERIKLIAELTEISSNLDTEYIQKLKDYWHKLNLHPWWYIYYTALCTSPPLFTYNPPEKNLKYTKILEMMSGFDTILKDFYINYSIQQIYDKKYKDIISHYVSRYSRERILNDRDFLHEYLRINKTAKIPDIIIVPLPFESHYSGKCIITENKLYILESIGAQSIGLNMHEYLHYFINEKVDSIDNLNTLPIAKEYERNRESEFVRDSYNEPYIFVSENIVRAIDHRIRFKRGEGSIDLKTFTENGLSLVEYFYNRLNEYEVNETKYKNIYEFIEDAVNSY